MSKLIFTPAEYMEESRVKRTGGTSKDVIKVTSKVLFPEDTPLELLQHSIVESNTRRLQEFWRVCNGTEPLVKRNARATSFYERFVTGDETGFEIKHADLVGWRDFLGIERKGKQPQTAEQATDKAVEKMMAQGLTDEQILKQMQERLASARGNGSA